MGINRCLDQGMFCFRSPKKKLKLDLTEPQKNSNPNQFYAYNLKRMMIFKINFFFRLALPLENWKKAMKMPSKIITKSKLPN